ncbi:MAG: c-type cytochrome domain-containing protein, partial [Verrucomicrobiota bacterium]
MSRTSSFALLTLLAVTANGAPEISNFLDAYCISCHGPEKAKDNIRLDLLPFEMSDRKDAELWHRVLESLQFGEMPSDKAKKFPAKAEVRAVTAWISKSLVRSGRALEDKAKHEGYGNLVPHELLFSSAERHRAVDVGARIWRISPETLRSLVGTDSTDPFPEDRTHGRFSDYKGKYLFNAVMTDQVTELAMKTAKTRSPARVRVGLSRTPVRGGWREWLI